MTVDQITETVAKCLMVAERLQCGHAGQREESRPGRKELDGVRLQHAAQHGTTFKTYVLFISGT